jgi:hypothetical protein
MFDASTYLFPARTPSSSILTCLGQHISQLAQVYSHRSTFSNDFHNHISTILHHERLKVLVQYQLTLRDYCADLPDLGRSNRV